MRTTASEKNRVTATLCCTASGKMLPPFVVLQSGASKMGQYHMVLFVQPRLRDGSVA